MRNILAHVPRKGKDTFAGELKGIRRVPLRGARERSAALSKKYDDRHPKAIETLASSLEDLLSFYAFPQLDSRKIASTNMPGRLNEEIRRRTRVIGIFPSPESYVRLVTTYLMEYSGNWSVFHADISQQSLATIGPAA